MLLQHLIDATGLLALSLNVSGMVSRDDRALVRTGGWASALWALNNLLMGAQAAAALSALSVGRQASASVLQDRPGSLKTLAFAVFILATVVAASLTWTGVGSAFMLAGSITATYAVFYLQGAGLRLAMVLVNALWLYNALAYDSWWQIAASVLGGGSAALAAWHACPGGRSSLAHCRVHDDSAAPTSKTTPPESTT